MSRERDAARGRRVTRSREVHEDGAALSPHPRPVVIAEHQHEIVEMVRARQAIGGAPRRKPDQPIVVAIGGILAPAVIGADRAQRKLVRGRGIRSAR